MPDKLIHNLMANKVLLLIFVFSAAIKLVLFFKLSVIHDDAPRFIAQAQYFADGDFSRAMAINRGIFLYPLLISAGKLFVGNYEISGKLISFLFSILTVFPLYGVGKELFNKNAGLIAALLFSVSPEFNSWSIKIMREPGFLFFFACSLFYFVVFSKSKTSKYFLLSFVFSVIAFLFRPDAIILIVYLLVFYSIHYFVNGGKPILFISIALISIISFFVVSYNFEIIRYNNIKLYLNSILDGGFFKYDTELKQSIKASAYATKFGWNHNNILKFVSSHMRSVYLLDYIFALSSLVFGLTIVPAYLGIRESVLKFRTKWPLLGLFVVFSLFYYLFLLKMNFLEPRYVFSVGLIVLVYSGYGCSIFLQRVNERRWRVLAAAGALLFVVWPAVESLKEHSYQIVSSRQAGLWLQENYDSAKMALLANNGAIPFYGGYRFDGYIDFFTFKKERYARIEKVGVRRKADLLGILLPNGRLNWLPEFREYRQVATFKDEKMTSLIYERVP